MEKLFTYVHENQHRECYLNKCKCNYDTYLQEYHAFKAELDFAYLNPEYRGYYVKILNASYKRFRKNPSTWKTHIKVVRNIRKSKKYKEVAGKL